MHDAVCIDLEYGGLNLLSTAATESGEDIAGGIQGGISHGVEILRDDQAHHDRRRRAFTRAGVHGQSPADHVPGDTDNQAVWGAEQQAARLIAKPDQRPPAAVFS